MSAAILQGVPVTTLDTDIWVDLPERAYMRVINLCHRLGANILAPTAVALGDETMINFLYRVDGLRPFATELRRAEKLRWLGTTVAVVPIHTQPTTSRSWRLVTGAGDSRSPTG